MRFLILLPGLLLAYFINQYSVNIPFMDQFSVYKRMVEIDAAKSLIGASWRQHNEHRLFFPYIAMLSMAKLTSWNTITECWLVFILGIGCFIVLWKMLRVSMLPISILFFCVSQWENWLWGFQIQILLMLLCFVSGIFLLTREHLRSPYIIGASLLGIISSFSYGNGLISLPIMALILLCKKKYLESILILAIFIITAFLYFSNYKFGDSHHGNTWSVLSFNYIRYALTFLGHPMAVSNFYSCFGAIGLTIFIAGSLYGYKKMPFNIFLGIFSIGLFAILSAFMIGVGRIGFGVTQALSSRYITIANLLWVADSAYMGYIVRNRSHKIILSVGITALLIPGYTKGWHEGRTHFEQLREAQKDIIRTYPAFNNETLLKIYPELKVKDMFIYLANKHLSLFSNR